MNIIRRSTQLFFQPLRSTTSATTSCSLKFCNAGRCANLLNPKKEDRSSTQPVIHQRLVYTAPWYIATRISSQKRSRWSRKVEQSISVARGIISRFSNPPHHNQLGLSCERSSSTSHGCFTLPRIAIQSSLQCLFHRSRHLRIIHDNDPRRFTRSVGWMFTDRNHCYSTQVVRPTHKCAESITNQFSSSGLDSNYRRHWPCDLYLGWSLRHILYLKRTIILIFSCNTSSSAYSAVVAWCCQGWPPHAFAV